MICSHVEAAMPQPALLAANERVGAPSTNYKAYKRAQEALQQLEDMTISDVEVDKFLPNELKRAKPQT
jgi:hypothetical protein